MRSRLEHVRAVCVELGDSDDEPDMRREVSAAKKVISLLPYAPWPNCVVGNTDSCVFTAAGLRRRASAATSHESRASNGQASHR